MRDPVRTMTGRLSSFRRLDLTRLLVLALFTIAGSLHSQSSAPVQNEVPAVPPLPQAQVTPAGPAPEARLIAIVPLDNRIPGAASLVNGDLQVYNGRALIAADASVTAGTQTAHVTLPNRGVLLVCPSTTVKLAADANVPAGEVPGLLMAMDHGAVEMSFATSRNADTVLTPDFRILISGPGASEVKVRLGPQGDTCVDNPGATAPYVLVSSVFDGGAYRVQPGQRVMFQHGSLNEVVDQETESCGCPPEEPQGNEFPVAQSESLALKPKPVPPMPSETAGSAEPVAPLIYKSADHVPSAAGGSDAGAASNASTNAATAAPKATREKKPGFFSRVGRFFKRVFGAE